MTIGQRIKEARKDAGFTQRELAEKSGTATGTIQQYERGVRQPRLDQLIRIAVALGVKWTELVPGGNKSETIAAYVIKNAGLTVKGKDREVIHQGERKSWEKVFPTPKERIDAAFEQLNDDGQEKAAESIEIIAGNPKYQRPASPDGPDTSPLEKPPESP